LARLGFRRSEAGPRQGRLISQSRPLTSPRAFAPSLLATARAGFHNDGMTRAARQEKWQRIPRTQLEPSHVSGCSVLPSKVHLLHALPKGGVVAEIGVAEGALSTQILDICSPSRLHLIDAWEGERYADGLAVVTAKFAGEISSGKVILNRGRSIESLVTFPDAYFDWVYLDTAHSFTTTWNELRLCASKVKPGGRIAGHDFCTGNPVTPVVYGVVQACHKFCVEHSWRYEFLTLDPTGYFSFCLRPIS